LTNGAYLFDLGLKMENLPISIPEVFPEGPIYLLPASQDAFRIANNVNALWSVINRLQTLQERVKEMHC
jgi:hypothetical protein